MTEPAPREGRGTRFVIEFFVIVASILAAFGLEAWWSDRVEATRSRAQLETLHAEFSAIHDDLGGLRERLESLRTAVAALLPHISPNAPLLTLDSLNALMDLSFRLGTVELRTGSLQALLAAGELAAIEDPALKALLAEWPAELAVLRRKSGLLEDNRELILDYLHARVPTLEIAYKTGQMGRYPRSDFTASAAVLQRDLRVEGLFGNRGMMIEDTDELSESLRERSSRILALIERRLGDPAR